MVGDESKCKLAIFWIVELANLTYSWQNIVKRASSKAEDRLAMLETGSQRPVSNICVDCISLSAI